jgi:hypothetical protein
MPRRGCGRLEPDGVPANIARGCPTAEQFDWQQRHAGTTGQRGGQERKSARSPQTAILRGEQNHADAGLRLRGRCLGRFPWTVATAGRNGTVVAVRTELGDLLFQKPCRGRCAVPFRPAQLLAVGHAAATAPTRLGIRAGARAVLAGKRLRMVLDHHGNHGHTAGPGDQDRQHPPSDPAVPSGGELQGGKLWFHGDSQSA